MSEGSVTMEPRTDSGRALVASYDPDEWLQMAAHIRAIEDEAAAPAGLDVERLAEIHWLLVNEVNRTDETYLDLLDWIEPLVSEEAADRADARLAAPPDEQEGEG